MNFDWNYDNVRTDEAYQFEEVVATGWFPRPLMDLACLTTMGGVMAACRDGGSLSPQLRLEVVNIVSRQQDISGRMRAHFKPISGAYLQLGLETWRAMTAIHGSHKAASAECSEDKLNKIEALTEKLLVCLTIDPFVWQTAYDLTDEVIQESKQ